MDAVALSRKNAGHCGSSCRFDLSWVKENPLEHGACSPCLPFNPTHLCHRCFVSQESSGAAPAAICIAKHLSGRNRIRIFLVIIVHRLVLGDLTDRVHPARLVIQRVIHLIAVHAICGARFVGRRIQGDNLMVEAEPRLLTSARMPLYTLSLLFTHVLFSANLHWQSAAGGSPRP